MAYTVIDDYSRSMQVSNLTEILTQAVTGSAFSTAQLQTNAESWAQAEISGYLSMQYNIAAEFQKTYSDPTRNAFVLQAMIDLALYRILFTVNPRDIPEHRKAAYDEAVTKMKAAMNGEYHIGLTRLDPSVSGGQRRIEIYSNKKFVSRPCDDPTLLNPETMTP